MLYTFTLLSLCTGALAMAIHPDHLTGSLATRQSPPAPRQLPWNIMLCTDKNFGGHCATSVTDTKFVLTAAGCLNLPDNDTKLQDSVSSVSVRGTHTCNVYQDRDCAGPSLTFSAAENNNLANIGFNDKISSVGCSKNL